MRVVAFATLELRKMAAVIVQTEVN